MVITDVFSIYSCSIAPHSCSPPLPPRPWRNARMQGWPNPLGCPTSTTSSWKRSWTSWGSSTSLSATRWAAQLLTLLLFRTSFLHWSLMSVCPPLLFIWPLWTEILECRVSVWTVWIESRMVSLSDKFGWKRWGKLPGKLWAEPRGIFMRWRHDQKLDWKVPCSKPCIGRKTMIRWSWK